MSQWLVDRIDATLSNHKREAIKVESAKDSCQIKLETLYFEYEPIYSPPYNSQLVIHYLVSGNSMSVAAPTLGNDTEQVVSTDSAF
jgi:hypothetical protein